MMPLRPALPRLPSLRTNRYRRGTWQNCKDPVADRKPQTWALYGLGTHSMIPFERLTASFGGILEFLSGAGKLVRSDSQVHSIALDSQTSA